MRKYLSLIILILSCYLFVYATDPQQAIYENINRSGGGYLAYPVSESDNTPPPAGYTPFYISHYGRHGSRYLIDDNDYKWVHQLFSLAESNNALTALGRSVKLRLDTIAEMCDGRGGDLSSVGVEQQKNIARRMYKSFPQIFKNGIDISARSAISLRCVLSMDAFCESLKEQNPTLNITRESSKKYMEYLNYHSVESSLYIGENGPWREMYNEFQKKHTHPERFINSLFSSKEFVEDLVNPANLIWALYWIASDMQDIPTDISFYDCFTKEELYDLWQVPNLRYYIKDGDFAGNRGMVVNNAKNLLSNIVDTADKVISSGKNSVTLRFGHDGNLIPLAFLMRLEGCRESINDIDKVKDIFQDYAISPMAANIQLIFFRNDKHPEDIIVKFMLNEREISIPVETPNFPFYKWTDVKNFYRSINAIPKN